ncbi:MAG: cysteine peptidase family C39 domain-containing protein, partial [Saprospiraceae bacterium]
MPKYPHFRQLDSMDCGATCLKMVARYHGRLYSLEYLRELSHIGKTGVSLADISEAAEKIGLHTLAVKLNYQRLLDDVPLPCIAHYDQNHFVVVYKISNSHVWLGDPSASEIYKTTKLEFLQHWG